MIIKDCNSLTSADKMFSEVQYDGPHGETSSLLDRGNRNITLEGIDNPDGGETTELLPCLQVLLHLYDCIATIFCYLVCVVI